MKTLKLDVDGVLRNFTQKSIELLQLDITHDDVDHFDYFTNITNMKKFMFENAKELFENAEPYYENIEVIPELSEKYKIKIVSAQHPELQKHTNIWLKKHEITKYVDEIIYTEQKHKINGDIFVDDNLEHIMKSRDEIVLCMRRPWNNCHKGVKYIENLSTLL